MPAARAIADGEGTAYQGESMEQGSNRNARVAELIRLACVMLLIVIAIGVFVFQDATVLYGALVSVESLAIMSNIIRRWRGRGPYAASVVRTSDHGRRDDV